MSIKDVIDRWNRAFVNHPVIEAFLLSLIAHFFIFTILVNVFESLKDISPFKSREKIIEIEFVFNEERRNK